jgi:hypothetical protein
MVIFDFKKQFNIDRLGTEQEGEAHFRVLKKFVLETSDSANIIFDLSGMAVFSHSYAKQTIAMLYEKLCNDEFQDRHFFVKVKDRTKVDDLEKAMEKIAKPILATTNSSISSFYDNYFLIGPLAPNLKEVLEIIIKEKEVTTGDLLKVSGESSVQNASNKVRKLEAMKLIERVTPTDRLGNVLYCRRIEVT